MARQALSFEDVLEDEYRYFFDEDPFCSVTFTRQHIREIGDLAVYLQAIFSPSAPAGSRFQLLARRCFGEGGAREETSSAEDAVLLALNRMLIDPALLAHLIKDDAFVSELIASPKARVLLRIPKARRLLLERKELAARMVDDGVIERFASEHAAIRLLRAEGFTPAFRMYPALLSTIADDKRLSAAVRDGEVRDKLLRAFRVRPGMRVWRWLVAMAPRAIREQAEKLLLGRPPDLVAMSQDARKLQHQIDPTTERDDDAQRIEEEYLSRFNAILIETAYSHYVSNGHTVRGLYNAIREKETAALCLSGGGIRSATFNLGVLQGLADHRMLNRFHYLSTVSGGGYIGSWLSSWIRRHQQGAIGAAKDLARKPSDPLQPEVKPIVHLREYSSYLAPRLSMFSLDAWTLAATYLRNLLLNWTMLVPFLAAVLIVPRLLETYIRQSMMGSPGKAGGVSLLLMVAAMAFIGSARPVCATSTGTTWRKKSRLWWWLLPIAGSAFAFCLYWAAPGNGFVAGRERLIGWFAAGAAVGAAIPILRRMWIDVMAETASTTTWWWGSKVWSWGPKVLAFLLAARKFRRRVWWQAFLELFYASGAGALGGWLLHVLFTRAFPPGWLQAGIAMERYVTLGMPLFLAVFFAEIALLVGFTTKWAEEFEREWWARAAAALFVYGLIHTLGAFAVLLLPALIYQAPAIAAPAGGISGLVSYLISRRLKGSKSLSAASARWLMPALRFAAALTMMFAVAGISMLTSVLILRIDGSFLRLDRLFDFSPVRFAVPWLVFGEFSSVATVRHFRSLRTVAPAALYFFAAAATLIAWFMSRRLNVNIFSMHGMYRNRLMRAYLGASRWARRPDPFTGFDAQDNVRMWELRPEILWPSCIVDFDGFARQLPAEKFWSRLPADVQNHVLAFLSADPEDRKEARETARNSIVDAINRLMLTYDLEHGVDSPTSPALMYANRNYLEQRFPKMLKTFEHDVVLPEPERVIKPCESKDAPDEFRDMTSKPVQGRPPLHVVNAALNLVSGENLAWQERKAASFTISALHAGSRHLGYRDSVEYGGANGITLGTALAVSGAAVSPNSGATSSPTFTFLMTLLNARLGWWIGNPAHRHYRRNSPAGSIQALLREALGQTDARHPFVFLSDGGHFDNLGLYEMVMRRCKYIVVCDATADSGYAFGDLANAVRKIRIDLGVPIEPLTTKYIGPQKVEKYGKYCALGEIRYGNVDGDSINGAKYTGHLLYIKPALYSESPPDVRNYGKECQSFPHETTADQFFSESQFESYRALGRHIIGAICRDDVKAPGPAVAPNVGAFFGSAYDYIHDKKPPQGDKPVQTMDDVVTWMYDVLHET